MDSRGGSRRRNFKADFLLGEWKVSGSKRSERGGGEVALQERGRKEERMGWMGGGVGGLEGGQWKSH